MPVDLNPLYTEVTDTFERNNSAAMHSTADFLKLLGLLTTGGVIVLGSVAFLVKHIIQRWIDRAFSVKEKEIDHQNKLLEHRAQVTFSSLHVSRAEVIRTIYHRLLDFKMSTLLCINKANLDDGHGGERFATAFEMGLDIHNLVEREAIYLDQDTCDLVLKVVHEYDQVFMSMQFGAGVPVAEEHYHPKLERSREIIMKAALPALNKLQDQFRRILGVD
ncbi:MAG TPA: hypothetical protein PL070_02090 [Flavobacteriales bacterium]|nr:hypothetical protein [Flavobacteriales bacterium]